MVRIFSVACTVYDVCRTCDVHLVSLEWVCVGFAWFLCFVWWCVALSVCVVCCVWRCVCGACCVFRVCCLNVGAVHVEYVCFERGAFVSGFDGVEVPVSVSGMYGCCGACSVWCASACMCVVRVVCVFCVMYGVMEWCMVVSGGVWRRVVVGCRAWLCVFVCFLLCLEFVVFAVFGVWRAWCVLCLVFVNLFGRCGAGKDCVCEVCAVCGL